MEPPSSDAEALREQQAARVRATNGLFVAADELRHLECGQQAIWQAFRLVRGRLLRDSIVDSNGFRIRSTFLMASSEDPRRLAPRRKAGETMTSEGRRTRRRKRRSCWETEPGGPAKE